MSKIITLLDSDLSRENPEELYPITTLDAVKTEDTNLKEILKSLIKEISELQSVIRILKIDVNTIKKEVFEDSDLSDDFDWYD